MSDTPPRPAPRRSIATDDKNPKQARVPVPKPRPRARQNQTLPEELPVKLLATNLPSKCSEDLLINYFESRRNFGRALDVEKVEYDSSKDRAVVLFQSNQHLTTVLDKHECSPCVISGIAIHVEAYKEDAERARESPESTVQTAQSQSLSKGSDDIPDSQTDTSILVVKGYPESKSTESLQYYFENRARSGGGDVVSLISDKEVGHILIQFVEKEAVHSVLEKAKHKPHEVEGCRLFIKPFIISRTDVLFTNVPESVSEESLKNFLEARLDVEVAQGPLAFNAPKDRVVVKFTEAVDIKTVEYTCKQRPIEGAYLVPMPVSISNTVLVTNLPDEASEDACRFYFENHRKSGGGTIENIDFQPDDGYCLISFENIADVDSVCQKPSHIVMCVSLRVTPYHVCLGKPTSPESSQPWVSPKPIVTQNKHEYKLKFIQSREEERRAVEKTFLAIHASINWKGKPVVIGCTITKQMKGYRKIGKTWTDEAQKELNRLMDTLMQHEFVTNPEVFPLFMKDLESVNLLYPDQVAVLKQKNENTVILVATHNAFNDSNTKIQRKLDGVMKELAKRKEKISKQEHLQEMQLRYLHIKNFEGDIKVDNPNVTVVLDTTECLMEVNGPQTEVNDVILAAYEKLQNLREKHVNIPKEALILLANPTTQQQIHDKMRQKDFLDLWEITDDTLTLYTDEGEDFSKKKMIFKRFYTQMEFEIDASAEILQRDDKWSELKQALQSQFQGRVVISKTGQNIRIFSRNDVRLDIQQMFQQFLDNNSILHEQIRIEKYILQFLQKHMEREIKDEMQAIQRRSEVTVEYKQADVVLIHGTADGLSSARALLEKMAGRVKVEKRPLKRPGIRQYMTSNKGQESIKSVETNTPCIIHIADLIADNKAPVVDQSQTLQMLGLTQACAEGSLPTGQKVIIYGGNMVHLQVDVLVNAANEEMKHTGGLAAAILKSGGRSIQKECSNLVARQGSVAIGNVLVSGAGKLPCKYIVHAVGPRWSGGTNQEAKLLQTVIENCLLETDTRGCSSIAFPALCTGVYRYPVDQACDLIITTIHQYFQNQRSSPIRVIYLCDINPKTVNTFMKSLSSIVGIKQVSAGDRTGTQTQTSDGADKSVSVKAQSGTVTTTTTTTMFGNTKVEIIKGNITSQTVDVIINSASDDLDLRKGKASHALLSAAGQAIQDECLNKYPNGISVGDVAVTQAGQLPCKHVLHICLEPFSHKKSVESLETCVENCLVEADKLGAQSVAFPALGTGNQGFPTNIVADTMFTCAYKYCNRHKDTTSIKTLKFVVFHMDRQIYEVFVSTISQIGNKGKLAPVPVDVKPDTSKIEKKVVKATKEFQIGDVQVFVMQGDITEQDTKAVVASSNPDLDLVNAGQVCKALLAKGGSEIEKDCDQKRGQMKSTGQVVITGGQLKCKHIIFVAAPGDAKGWEPVVYDCLRTAEGHGMDSIAFPVLGTVMGHDPGQIASLMYLAICRFVSGRTDPKSVKEVRIVIFQSTMLATVINGVKASIQGQSILSQLGHMFSRSKPVTKDKTPTVPTPPASDIKAVTQQDGVVNFGSDAVDNACVLTIYADDKRKIENAFKSLEKMINDDWYSQKIDDADVLKLDQKQIDNIEATAKKNNVQVKVDLDVGGIEIQGLIGNVMPVKDLIYEELRAFDRGVHEKKQAELLTSVVKWFWIDQSQSKPFEDVDNLKIESSFKNKDATVTITDAARNEDFEIDFQQMQKYYVENKKENYPVIRRDLIADSGTEIPSSWEAMGKDENLRMVKLADSSPEYKDVLAEFTKTLGRVPTIIEIHRIQNKTLYTQYVAKRHLMETNNPGVKNQHVLWHGTDAATVPSITTHGYNRSYCGKNAVVYGDGVYFAVNAQYSDRNGYARAETGTGHKRMYRALVLVGHYALGVQGMRVPPVRVQGSPDTLYDSVTNNMQDPAMFVIFHDTQAYPEHIITYT